MDTTYKNVVIRNTHTCTHTNTYNTFTYTDYYESFLDFSLILLY